MTDKAKKRRRALAKQHKVSTGTAANMIAAKRKTTIDVRRLNDPSMKTKVVVGAYQDPIRSIEVINGPRKIGVWFAPMGSQGSSGWGFEVTHQTGPWPLHDDERDVLEDWLVDFAKREWPNRMQNGSVTYRALPQASGVQGPPTFVAEPSVADEPARAEEYERSVRDLQKAANPLVEFERSMEDFRKATDPFEDFKQVMVRMFGR